MLSVDIRLIADGKELALDSFIETIVTQVRLRIREEVSRIPVRITNASIERTPGNPIHDKPPLAVSKREAAQPAGCLRAHGRQLHRTDGQTRSDSDDDS
jgi:hypothetical protein